MRYNTENIDFVAIYSEQEIVEGCIDKDRKMQKLLYERYCNAMYSTSYRILSDYDLANDCLQEAFIKVFRNIKKFRGEATLGAWIKTIVIRVSLNRLKKEKMFIPLEETNLHLNSTIPNVLSGEYLEKIILELPLGLKTVFLLVEVEGYSHKEVAEMLGINVGTSRSQLHHAKQKLRKKIDKLKHYR